MTEVSKGEKGRIRNNCKRGVNKSKVSWGEEMGKVKKSGEKKNG